MYAFLSLIVFISSAQAISIFSSPKKEMAAWYDLLIARETVQRTRDEAVKAANDPKLKELRTEAHKASQELEKKSYEAHKFFQDGLKDLNFQIDDLRNRLKYRIADRTLAATQQKSAQKLNNLLDTIDKWTLKYSQSFTTAIREYTQANVQGKSKNLEDVNAALQDLEKEIRKKVEEAEALVLSIKDNEEYKKSIKKWAQISEQLINTRKSISEKTRAAISRFDDKATEQLDVLKKAIGPVKCKILTTIADISDRNMIGCAVAKISSEQKMLDLPACKNLEVSNGSKKRIVSPDKPLKEYRDCIGVYVNKKWPYTS
jgi:uncharacterized protein YukE